MLLLFHARQALVTTVGAADGARLLQQLLCSGGHKLIAPPAHRLDARVSARCGNVGQEDLIREMSSVLPTGVAELSKIVVTPRPRIDDGVFPRPAIGAEDLEPLPHLSGALVAAACAVDIRHTVAAKSNRLCRQTGTLEGPAHWALQSDRYGAL